MSERSWQSRVAGDLSRVLFMGPEGRLTARLIQGGFRGEALRAVMCLSQPSLLRRIQRGGSVRVTGRGGKDLELYGGASRVTLRFPSAVPASLIRDLRDVFEFRRPPGELSREAERKGREMGQRSGEARRARRSRWADEDEGAAAGATVPL